MIGRCKQRRIDRTRGIIEDWQTAKAAMTRVFFDDFNGSSLDAASWNANWYGADPMTSITVPVAAGEIAAYDPARISFASSCIIFTTTFDPITIGARDFDYRTGAINSRLKRIFTPPYCLRAKVWIEPYAGTVVANWPGVWMNGVGPWPSDGENDTVEGLQGNITSNYHKGAAGVDVPIGSQPYPGDNTGWNIWESIQLPGQVVWWIKNNVRTRTWTSGLVPSGDQYMLAQLGMGELPGMMLKNPGTMKIDWIEVLQPP